MRQSWSGPWVAVQLPLFVHFASPPALAQLLAEWLEGRLNPAAAAKPAEVSREDPLLVFGLSAAAIPSQPVRY